MPNLWQKTKDFLVWLRADRKRMIAAVIILTAVFALWYILFGRNRNKATQYQTAIVTKGTIVSSVSASGQILSSNTLNISTSVAGVVKAVYVKNGDKVVAGQKIAEITLDSDAAVASAKAWSGLVSAQNSLNAAKNNYRLTQATLANVYDQIKGHDSDETFAQRETRTKAEVANDNAYDAIKVAEANLVSASVAYRQISPIITAPAGGTVDNVTITAGMTLSTSDATSSSNRVAVVTSKGNILSTFNVSEVDVNRVVPGQKATITLDSISGKLFTGKVLTVDKIGTISSGVTNYPVIISLDTKAPEILPNMAATANIIIESKENVLLVPSEAINIKGNINTVRVLKNGRVREVTFEIGLSSDTQVEVVSGLSEGDIVITGTGASFKGPTSPFSTFRVGR